MRNENYVFNLSTGIELTFDNSLSKKDALINAYLLDRKMSLHNEIIRQSLMGKILETSKCFFIGSWGILKGVSNGNSN